MPEYSSLCFTSSYENLCHGRRFISVRFWYSSVRKWTLNIKTGTLFCLQCACCISRRTNGILVYSGEEQIVWRENLKARYSCIVSGVAGERWKVLGEANTCNHCIGQANHLAWLLKLTTRCRCMVCSAGVEIPKSDRSNTLCCGFWSQTYCSSGNMGDGCLASEERINGRKVALWIVPRTCFLMLYSV